VLLVDDLADSGHTLTAVVHQLRTNYPPISELRSAVIWTKGVCTFQARLLGGRTAHQPVDSSAF